LDKRDFEFLYKNALVVSVQRDMEEVNHLVTAMSAFFKSSNRKGHRNYQMWFAKQERMMKHIMGDDKPKGYADYKKFVAEMTEKQNARKKKKDN